MERREVISAVGAAAVAMSATQALANEHEHHAAGEHHHPTKFPALAKAANKCVLDGENNLRHCFGMVAMGDTTMAECIKLTYDVISACRSLAALAATDSRFTKSMAVVVETICAECKKECDKFLQYTECKEMAESCAACADECKKLKA